MDAGSWGRRLRDVPAPVVDAVLALGLAVAVTVAIGVAPEQRWDPDAAAYALGPVLAALAMLRRRWPLAVLLASAAVLFTYNLTPYPGLFASVPLSVALATAWAAGHRVWALAVAAYFGGGPLVFMAVSDLPPELSEQLLYTAITDVALLAAVLLLGEAVRGRRALGREHRLLLAEQDRSERLLLNVLPAPIADRLKQGEAVIADRFPDVTVLFADLVGYTASSDRSSPERVVQVLGDLFSALDRLAQRHGLEKIKTVGDAYMVAGGCPSPGPTTPRRWPSWPWTCARRSPATSTRPAGPWPCASASTPARWSPGSSAPASSATTCGATP